MFCNKLVMLATAIVFFGSPPAFSFDMPKLPGASAAAASAVDASAMQESIVRTFISGSSKINEAQIELAKAFDLKEQVAALEADAKALGSGATDQSTLDKATQNSKAANDAIAKHLADGKPLSEEGKKHYVASLSPFASGLLITAKMPADLKEFGASAQQQVQSASLIQKASVVSKLAPGMFLVKELPGYTANALDSFKKIVTYAKSNSIPIPADATAAAGL